MEHLHTDSQSRTPPSSDRAAGRACVRSSISTSRPPKRRGQLPSEDPSSSGKHRVAGACICLGIIARLASKSLPSLPGYRAIGREPLNRCQPALPPQRRTRGGTSGIIGRGAISSYFAARTRLSAELSGLEARSIVCVPLARGYFKFVLRVPAILFPDQGVSHRPPIHALACSPPSLPLTLSRPPPNC
ncbi:hypothetical protein FB451DRAFT_1554543 [Mycena latifolia]|nr:hypothetical protein FB451DRAFT_1554543 [Mycena latifolia]